MPKTSYPISNSLMFAKVMSLNPDICRRVVEQMIGQEVEGIEYITAERLVPSVRARSVQLDVALKATGKTVNLEMQTYDRGDLGRRMRIHRSLLDSTQVAKSADFADVDDCYVVFFCTFDPFRQGLARYELRTTCTNCPVVGVDDGAIGIAYNGTGDMSGLGEELRDLLTYLQTNNAEGASGLTAEIARAVDDVNESEVLAMGVHTFEQELKDRYRFGLRTGREETEARVRALVAKMAEAGADATDIVDAMDSEDMETLFEKYGV